MSLTCKACDNFRLRQARTDVIMAWILIYQPEVAPCELWDSIGIPPYTVDCKKCKAVYIDEIKKQFKRRNENDIR